MATQFAIQPSVYESVSRANRQRRAAGRVEPVDAGYTAYRAAQDAAAARALQADQIALNRELGTRQLEIQEEARKDQAKAGMVSGATSLALTGAYLYDKFATPVAAEAAAITPSAVAPTAATGGQAALASAAPAAAGGQAIVSAEAGHIANAGGQTALASSTPAVASETAGALAPGTLGAGLAAGAASVGIEVIKNPISEWAQDTFGGEAGAIVGVGARAGQGALVGAAIGGAVGAGAGAIIGGLVGVVEEASHICTATNKAYGLSSGLLIAMKKLREYAINEHKKEFQYYLDECKQLLLKIDETSELGEYLRSFKQETAPAVAELIEANQMEMAYQVYRQKAEELFIKHKPGYEPIVENE